MPATLQPSTISLLPAQLEVMKTTSAPQERYVAVTSCITAGRPPVGGGSVRLSVEWEWEEAAAICIRTSRFRVPETHPLRLDVLVDEAGDGGTERLLLLRPDPDQIPAKNTAAVSARLDIDHAIGGRSSKGQGGDAAARYASLANSRYSRRKSSSPVGILAGSRGG